MRQASGSSVTSTSQLMCRCTGVAGTMAAMGNTSSAAMQALQRAGHDLLDGHQLDRQRGEHAVLDLAGVAELLHERQGHGLDALEEDDRGDDAGDQRGGVGRAAGAAARTATDAEPDLGQHVGEHEHQQERLDQRAGQELLEVVREHVGVAEQQGPEGATRPTRGRPTRTAASRALGVASMVVIRAGPSR